MTTEKKINILFEILSSEQTILQRTDQKAFTMLSLLGVFAVFFIVHYTRIPPTVVTSILITIYFVSIISAIYFFVRVVSPRLKESEKISPQNKTNLPTFFGGIVKYKSAEHYAEELGIILDDEETTYQVFSKSVFSIGRINSYKHKYLKYGIRAFVLAIGVEFSIIIMLYLRLMMLQSN